MLPNCVGSTQNWPNTHDLTIYPIFSVPRKGSERCGRGRCYDHPSDVWGKKWGYDKGRPNAVGTYIGCMRDAGGILWRIHCERLTENSDLKRQMISHFTILELKVEQEQGLIGKDRSAKRWMEWEDIFIHDFMVLKYPRVSRSDIALPEERLSQIEQS